MGARALGTDRTTFFARGLRQLLGVWGPRTYPRRLWHQLRPSGGGKAKVRSAQLLPIQPKHPPLSVCGIDLSPVLQRQSFPGKTGQGPLPNLRSCARRMTAPGEICVREGSIASLRYLNQRTVDQHFLRTGIRVFDCLLRRSLAKLATSSYVCCSLGPVIAGVIFFGHGWLELADLRSWDRPLFWA